MLGITKIKTISILVVCAIGILLCVPNFLSPAQIQLLPSWMRDTVSLGLELQGGSHIQLEVDLESAQNEFLSSVLTDVRTKLRKENIGYTKLNLDHKTSKIQTLLRDNADVARAMDILKKIDPSLQANHSTENPQLLTLGLSEQAIISRSKQIIEQSKEVVRRRVDETGTKEPTILSQGNNRIIVQLPGVDNPEEIKKRIGTMAKMNFHLVDENQSHHGSASPEVMILEEQNSHGEKSYLAVKRAVALSGDNLSDAQFFTSHETGQVGVSLRFNNLGTKIFAEITSNNLGKRLAVVLDNKVITAPALRVPILDGRAEITGNFDVKSANELALLLRAGSLPAVLKVVEERTVGPSLGTDSIKDGKHATIIAFLFVSGFMIAGYSLFGVFANVALIFNLVLLFAGLSLLQATLTLPGIAGIAMTIGMAVDANVLIYERIKEELRNNMQPLTAIEAGYKRAMSTIVDSNLTTLIGAAVLYEFGSGPIRGFGVTLALGIVVSMFTALSLTKLITAWWFKNKDVAVLPI